MYMYICTYIAAAHRNSSYIRLPLHAHTAYTYSSTTAPALLCCSPPALDTPLTHTAQLHFSPSLSLAYYTRITGYCCITAPHYSMFRHYRTALLHIAALLNRINKPF